MSAHPKITVYVPSQHYGEFLPQALESVLRQSERDFELIVIDDGSQDQTSAVAARFQAAHPLCIRVLRFEQSRGLRAAANAALEAARGRYIMRLDADDFLDHNALLVLSHFLDQHPEIGLVFPNWSYVDREGRELGVERRVRFGEERELLDLPAHGACTMIRTRVLKTLGGYDEQFDAQDGHELWLKAVQRFGVGQVETPLFFYRQHADSMSQASERLHGARRAIKQAVAESNRGPVALRTALIIPVKYNYPNAPGLALRMLGGKPLLDHTLDAIAAHPWAGVMVSTDDDAVLEHCERRGVPALKRAGSLSEPMVTLPEVFAEATFQLEQQHQWRADIVVALSVHTPLRKLAHIEEAINTLMVYPVDQVISTFEVNDLVYRHGRLGMTPINAGQIVGLRHEREALYACNGSIHVMWREFLAPEHFLSGRVGHVVMSRSASLMAKKPEEWLLLEKLCEAEHQPVAGAKP
jgi:CMP-N-acetylneuraminic acid synthetase